MRFIFFYVITNIFFLLAAKVVAFGYHQNDVYVMKQPRWTHKQDSFPFQNYSLSWNQRADDLVSRLTLDEIVPQTLAVYGSHTPAIDRLSIKPYVWITECLHGQVGSNTTAFPQSLGLAASFRSEKLFL